MLTQRITGPVFDPDTGKTFDFIDTYDDQDDRDLFGAATTRTKVFLGGGNDSIMLQARDD